MPIRIGLLGTNTSHAGVFAGILNAGAPGAALGGARVTAVYSSGRPGLSGPHPDATELAQRHHIDDVVDDPGELIGSVDAVLVVDDFEGGSLHATLARPFLAAGIPTFVDKPMTLEIADALELFELAERHNAPLFSSSALRFAHELHSITSGQLGTLRAVVSAGPGDWYNYGIHALEAAYALAGGGARWVHQHPSAGRDVTVVGRDDGPRLVVETLRDASYLFHLAAYGTKGMAQVQVADFDAFYAATMAAVVQMVRTAQPPVSRHDTLEILAVLAAGHRSAQTGTTVALRDILPVGAR